MVWKSKEYHPSWAYSYSGRLLDLVSRTRYHMSKIYLPRRTGALYTENVDRSLFIVVYNPTKESGILLKVLHFISLHDSSNSLLLCLQLPSSPPLEARQRPFPA